MATAVLMRLVFFGFILWAFAGCSSQPAKKIEPDDAKKQLKTLKDDLHKEHGGK